MLSSNEIRSKYLKFFEERSHAVIPSASLVPQNDPTTLFTGSGMQPLIPYLLGQPHPKGVRLVDSQKSFRAADIEEVGDNRHTTFFEMLGNWSLGDYFKQDQLPWIFKFLTDKKEGVGLDASKLYVTVFDGAADIGVPRDEESIGIWKNLFASLGVDAEFVSIGSEANGYEVGMQGGRIFGYTDKNWWSRAGAPAKMPEGEPGGPDSEVFYDFGTPHDEKWGKECHPNCDCGRFMEIGNSVFMEYIKKDGKFEKLAQQNVDFGGGLERIAAAVNGDPDVFKAVDSLWTIVDALQAQSGTTYESNTTAYRIVADHMRGTVFMLTDGVLPSNTERGYFLRRLIRRAVRYADVIGYPAGSLSQLARVVADSYGGHYPEVVDKLVATEKAIGEEEARFRETLANGLREFVRVKSINGVDIENIKTINGVPTENVKKHNGARVARVISGKDAFILFTTHGFPIELTVEIAKEKGFTVDLEGFRKEMESHRDMSRAGAEQKFKGGLADQSEAVVRLHTAHHLLLKALQMVLGPQVKQRGSNITGERLRIDFAHTEKMTDQQKKEVERIVNEKIAEELPVLRNTLPRAEAEKLGAEMEFGAKYPDTVTVYSIGPTGATLENPQFDKAFSMEFCGGPHVENTAELAKSGTFGIQKEEASGAGIRRIKAVLA